MAKINKRKAALIERVQQVKDESVIAALEHTLDRPKRYAMNKDQLMQLVTGLERFLSGEPLSSINIEATEIERVKPKAKKPEAAKPRIVAPKTEKPKAKKAKANTPIAGKAKARSKGAKRT
ncbi:MAG: hypothetical protein ACOH13_12880 [Flavobacteriales bacterium]